MTLVLPFWTSDRLGINAMVGKDNSNKRPPYPPFSQWQRLLNILRDDIQRHQLPSRIDNSYLKKLKINPSAESNLQSALAFLGLIDQQRHPTDILVKLLSSEGTQARDVLRKIVDAAYVPILDGLTPRSATPDHLAEKFKRGGSQDEVGRKGMTFFLGIAREAGIELSPQLKTRERQPNARSQRKKTPQATETPASPDSYPFPQAEQVPPLSRDQDDLIARLLAKFPDYNPEWDSEQVFLWRDSLTMILAEVRTRSPLPD